MQGIKCKSQIPQRTLSSFRIPFYQFGCLKLGGQVSFGDVLNYKVKHDMDFIYLLVLKNNSNNMLIKS